MKKMKMMAVRKKFEIKQRVALDLGSPKYEPVRKAVFLAQELNLPTKEVLSVLYTTDEPVKVDYTQDPDSFLNKTLIELEALYPELEAPWKSELSSHVAARSRLIPKEDLAALEVLIEKLQETSFASPLALIEISVLFTRSLRIGEMVANLIPWFIRYGSIELITQTTVIDSLKHNFYREYIARLPPEELHEFLLSNTQGERVMAKNKFSSELLEG